MMTGEKAYEINRFCDLKAVNRIFEKKISNMLSI